MDIKQFLIDNKLPLPETILYAPADKVEGFKLITYEIDNEGMFGVVEVGNGAVQIRQTLEQIKMCTWKDREE